jgi:hypothetical protein
LIGILLGKGVPRHCGLVPSIWVPAGTVRSTRVHRLSPLPNPGSKETC